mgnify:CR=1 FL=1
MRIAVLTALAVFALPLPAQWVRLASPHFTLFTDAGEKTGRQLLVSLEQVREVFRDLGGGHKGSPLSVRVYLFASPKDYRHYQSLPAVKGFYQGGPDVNHIVLLSSDAETRRIAFHEYVHLVLNHSSLRLPQWLEEGTAEFYSTLEPRAAKLVVGRPIESHVRTLAVQDWLDGATLAAVTRRSPLLDEASKAGIFYAQSWALVHMMNFDEDYRRGLPRYAELLADGEPAAEIFEKAFGRSLDQALSGLRSYLAAGRWATAEVPWNPPEPVTVVPEPLTEADRDLALLNLQFALGLWDISEHTLRALARRREESPEVETARAKLAMSRKDFEAARRHFETAIALGSREPSTYFEYAMLLRDSGGDRDQVTAHLRKTVELNPHHAEAHFLLGRLEGDVEHLRRAAEILPRQTSFWHALAVAYHEDNRPDLARSAARRALEAAVTEAEREMAQAALALVARTSETPAERPAVTTPRSWFPRQGDSRIEGLLENIDCLGPSARLQIRSGDRRLALFVEDPTKVQVKNVSSHTFEFSCGRQQARPVVVEYLAAPDSAHESAGTVTSIELR